MTGIGSSPVSDKSRTASFPNMLGYGLGECANSLVMNGLFGFAMLYYTEALRLSPALAGIAMSASVFWEAVTDPVMGYVSDRTRHRFGRRHPWMLAGGLLMALCFYFLWDVPEALHGRAMPLFAYLVTMNLLLRTGLTMFFIPYMALGFELTPDYEGRSKIQAVRQVMNMAANFAGPALAWSIFFRDSVGPDGAKTLGTAVPQNFVHMGAVFSLATVVFVLATLWLTRGWITDTRSAPVAAGDGVRHFWAEMRGIVTDLNARWVLVFIFFACVAMVLVSSLQMYVYVYYMKFGPEQKSIAHGSTMIGMAAGAALSAWIAKHLDKKGAVLVGGALSILCNGVLAALFLTGWVPTGTLTALVLFVAFHATFWLGNGILLPPGVAMMADVAELYRRRSGVNRDGAYSAVFSLSMRLAISFALMASGWTLSAIGFSADTVQGAHTAQTVWRLGAATFLAGPLMSLIALSAVLRYPLNRRLITELDDA